ncbi:hypothetical protein CRG98_012573 [Punica granatum]|uniref:Protein kinase domain-containing protein n=1 Tax=Punica granatum TaxID=22663 RepID=A0A2I0KEV7_PUNGR|nr:hypothetical protein CRG98_012573 [Punica granatum]
MDSSLVPRALVGPQEPQFKQSLEDLQFSNYAENCRRLLCSLPSNVTANGGFFSGSLGTSLDTVYALSFCIGGDLPAQNSTASANSTSMGLMESCPYQKQGAAFEGDFSIARYSYNPIYGILNKSIDMMNWCRDNSGGVVCYPSCYLRWDLYYIYVYSPAPPQPSPPPPPSSPPPPGAPPPASTNTTSIDKGKRKISVGVIVAIVVPIFVAVVVFLILCCFLRKRTMRRHEVPQYTSVRNDITTTESLLFDFEAIQAAATNFSAVNKLGEGGFRVVYKGWLHDGQYVAVKRLFRSSAQGTAELKNEVEVVDFLAPHCDSGGSFMGEAEAKRRRRPLLRSLTFSLCLRPCLHLYHP